MKQPLISIIVPVYNAQKYLSECIRSIVNQTYTNLEIILVNDGSKDNSLQICREFAKQDSRIVVLDKENGGQATARNMALDIARGAYIGFVDSDDTVELDMYDTLMKALLAHGADISMCGRYNVYPNGEQKEVFVFNEEQIWTNKEAVRRFLTWDGIDGAGWDKLISRDLFEGVRFPAGLICEDLPVVYELIKKAEKVVHIGAPKYYYYQIVGSTSHGVFSPKTRGLIVYPKEIYLDAVSCWPDLKEEAEYYYGSSVYCAAKKYAQTSSQKEDWVISEVLKCEDVIWHNTKITTRTKWMMKLCRHRRLYRFLRQIVR